MGTIGWSSKGSFKNTEDFLNSLKNQEVFSALSHWGQVGVDALSKATPEETGETALAWFYEIIQDRNSWSIVWGNTHDAGGTPVAVLLQLGHGTGTGGYVQGRDYINPALKPIFDQIENEAWKLVTG